MTTERMLELLCLTQFLDKHKKMLDIRSYGEVIYKVYDIDSIIARRNELEVELLNPYVIDNAEKSE